MSITFKFYQSHFTKNYKRKNSNLLQTSPSAHSGAISASNMASASLTGGNFHPSAFMRLCVSDTILYFGLFLNTMPQVWINSSTFIDFYQIDDLIKEFTYLSLNNVFFFFQNQMLLWLKAWIFNVFTNLRNLVSLILYKELSLYPKLKALF